MKLKMIIILLFFAGLASAQESTLIDADISSFKGFGAIVAKYSSINSNDAFTVGGRGGWIFDNSFFLGAGIYGLVSYVPVDVLINNSSIERTDKLHFMYGGVELEYVFKPKNIVHYSIYTLIGLGFVSSQNYDQPYPDSFYDHSHMTNAFFVMEPSFNVTLNIAKFFQVAVGVGYLVTSGADYQTIRDKSLSGLTGNFTLRFKGSQ